MLEVTDELFARVLEVAGNPFAFGSPGQVDQIRDGVR